MVLFSNTVVSLILGIWDFGAVIQVFGQPALSSDLDGWINVVVAWVCQVGSAGRDGRDERDDRDGRSCCAESCICVRIRDRFCADSG